MALLLRLASSEQPYKAIATTGACGMEPRASNVIERIDFYGKCS
jgi:hypothetical protein